MLNISYQVIEDVVLSHGDTVSAAEAHGMLAGMLSIDAEFDAGQWLSEVFGDARDELDLGEKESMFELYAATRKLIEAVDFSFGLLLPEDEVSLTERARALSGWCAGFLYGVGYFGEPQRWTGDSEEVLRDLADISRLDADAAGEEDEVAYAEICEFVRVGVQLIRGDTQPQPINPHLH